MISLTSPVRIWAHSARAGVKLGLLSLATGALFATESPVLLGVAAAGAGALYVSGGTEFARAGLRSLRLLWPFLLVIAIWHGLTGQIAAGIAVTLRLLTAVALANFVTMTTQLSDMIAVMSSLLAPVRRLGLSTRALELSVALVVRFTPTLARKGQDLVESWRARSPRRPGWQIVIPMAALAIDDAEQVAEALRARGGME
ncbi:energy-coupling factor transporter transmembrane component T [Puniceibacterium confluentis]|uniref:energy-coupling factor transporter transmembrane component T n=1 Tax=Puniceibacterium confluentis TaxID=1958944 RepID=UPI0011B48F33|nr:energy-coupling factor transporter transmembrane component T [Puniceibacterium confluentis]